ncbi:MAG: hypothetical protein ACKO1N_02635 [Erythrobacter sp.]
MALSSLVPQTAGSLVAILALAGLAKWMRLGRAPTLVDDAAVRRAASEVEDGFVPVSIARDKDGTAALARDGNGRIMVIKRHGNRFAGRVLGDRAAATLSIDHDDASLAIMTGETLFGDVRIVVDDPDAWVAAINRLSGSQHA